MHAVLFVYSDSSVGVGQTKARDTGSNNHGIVAELLRGRSITIAQKPCSDPDPPEPPHLPENPVVFIPHT